MTWLAVNNYIYFLTPNFMPYNMLDDDKEDFASEARKGDIKEEYQESTKVDDDEKDFLTFTYGMSKVEREIIILSEEFHDGELNPYEAKVKLLALLDIVTTMRDELIKAM
jgi:hypothetical protein